MSEVTTMHHWKHPQNDYRAQLEREHIDYLHARFMSQNQRIVAAAKYADKIARDVEARRIATGADR